METIPDLFPQIKGFLARALDDWGVALLVVLVGLSCFGLGRISAQQSHNLPIIIHSPEAPPGTVSGAAGDTKVRTVQAAAVALPLSEEGGQYVASKNGSSYHLPWCSGAKSISDKNKVYFASEEEAVAAGYKPAKNCKGLGGN